MQSNVHVLVQPTPVPLALPRSHSSVPSIFPSPHTGGAPPVPLEELAVVELEELAAVELEELAAVELEELELDEPPPRPPPVLVADGVEPPPQPTTCARRLAPSAPMSGKRRGRAW
jgi:hypothetical protein